ncbi:invasion associated locus B family protein [Tropicibacter sp. Alg240-R139]|uniref:invasion associated locus B family protein n=1 Tax=Tropicibacter sp. Alg240-R139 TaxID=2305991 RepID=UPI0013E01EBA|nr:invasion associated locus B family protein [Tropicibacter sp. Alg240-R139]
MFKSIISLSSVTALLFATAAVAQDTTTEETKPEAEQTGAVEGSEALDLGEPVAEGPKLGERYSKDKFGDWDLACIKTEEEQDPCSLLQIMTDPQNNPMAEISLFRLAGNQAAVAGATIVVPLETLLPAQLTVSIDGAPGKRYNYSFCNPIGCVAQIGLTQTDIDAMKKGAKATVSLVPAPAPDQTISLDLSLSGFTAGFDVVDVVTN